MRSVVCEKILQATVKVGGFFLQNAPPKITSYIETPPVIYTRFTNELSHAKAGGMAQHLTTIANFVFVFDIITCFLEKLLSLARKNSEKKVFRILLTITNSRERREISNNCELVQNLMLWQLMLFCHFG